MADEHIKIGIGAVKEASTGRVLREIRGDYARLNKAVGGLTRASFAEAARHARRAQQQLENEGRQNVSGALRDARALNNIRRTTERARLATNERIRRAEKATSEGRLDDAKKEERAALRNARTFMQASQTQAAHSIGMARRQSEDKRRRTENDFRRRESIRMKEQRAHSIRWNRRASIAAYEVTGALGRFLPAVPSIGQMGYYATELARGVGVDLSPASQLSTAVGMQSEAIRLSNAGIIPGDPENTRRVAPREFTDAAFRVGNRYGIRGSDVQSGITQFQKVTGDTALAMKLLDPLTRLNVASGTNQAEGFNASANIAMQLGHMSHAEKIAAMTEVTRTFIGQGKKGAFEYPDLARYAPALLSPTRMFEGDPVETMKKLGALAQFSRAYGGSNNPAMAARSVARFATTMKKSARVKAFRDQGIEPYNEHGLIRDPIALIREAIQATGGKPDEWQKLFAELIGERAPGGAADPFRKARIEALEGGATEEQAMQAGLAAFDKFTQDMFGQTFSPEMEASNLQEWMKGTEAQANKTNNELSQIASEVLPEFTSSLREVTPSLKTLASFLGEAVATMVEWPKLTVALAALTTVVMGATAAFARALIEMGVMRFAGASTLGGAAAKVGGGAAAATGLRGLAARVGLRGAATTAVGMGARAVSWPAAVLAGLWQWDQHKRSTPEGIAAAQSMQERTEERERNRRRTNRNRGKPLSEEEQARAAAFEEKMETVNSGRRRGPPRTSEEDKKATDGLANAMNRLASSVERGLTVNINASDVPGGLQPGQRSSVSGAP